VQSLYAFLPPVLSSTGECGSLGSLREPTYRLYNCQRCGVQVRICSRCDHGNIYCAGKCARIRRRESVRRAGRRYQRTPRGARHHAQRQRVWRERRRQKVTHQGCNASSSWGSVSVRSISPAGIPDATHAELASIRFNISEPHCSFCQTPLSDWARWHPWRWSG
jgi:hypothetical protein